MPTGKGSSRRGRRPHNIYVRDTHIRDIAELSVTIRPEDRDEVWHLAHIDIAKALAMSVGNSRMAKTVLLDSRVVCIFGVAGEGEIGAPWMLASPLLKDIRRSFVRECKEYLEEMSKGYSILTNVTWAKNIEHHRWLNWLGFILEDPRPMGPDGELYIPFYKVVE